ncbi:uncharacterized protein TNCV_2620311 [Trichonephila clavipes]|uniref:DNA-directed DNA polymerase n=1 Tax=Trichonephila clavipes TaxID=2585209 RepID=A0A8X7BIQ1_TRICX|nr:uncharacterized protein TNCV_2620311 [Trichonephila clavipes]
MSSLLNHLTSHEHKVFFCDYCLLRFNNEELLNQHQEDCRNHNVQKIKMPTQEEKWLEFSNHKFKLPVPYVIYADLECILEKINSCEQDPKISSTESIAKHVPCGFAYVIVGPDGTMVKPPTVFRGKNAIDQFLTKLLDEEKSILDILRFVKPMVFSMTDEENFKSSTLCSIYENPLNGDATQLPPQSAFFNSLTNENVSREDYEYAHHIWNIFQMHTLGDYHDLYVTVDVLLLSDIFENLRTLCQNYYKIDPCHTYTAPGLAWQACLKMTKVRLELLTDIDMHLFIEKGIRGGVAMISHRYAKANNAYLSNYDSSLPSSYIIYLDANNLYGWAMSQHLPTHDFSWTDEDVNFMNVPDDSEIGYIFEVDLEYPDELHDLDNCYPLAPEKIEVKCF